MSIAITALITLLGLYLAHNLRRQQRLRIADQRLASYRQLWQQLLVARPSRLDPYDGAGPLTSTEIQALYAGMTEWYFDDGNGMMLTEPTLRMYLEAKRRLAKSAVAAEAADPDRDDSERRIQELSLLRTQMKFDVAIYGTFYEDALDNSDRDFLRACGLNPSRWARPLWQRAIPRRLIRRRAPLRRHSARRADAQPPQERARD